MTVPRLRLGTRQSPLAMAQAEEARNRLCAAHGWSVEDVELVKVRTSGDKIQDRPLADIGGKGAMDARNWISGSPKGISMRRSIR